MRLFSTIYLHELPRELREMCLARIQREHDLVWRSDYGLEERETESRSSSHT